MSPERPLDFDPVQMARVLNAHDVHYVFIGGLAAILHGAPTYTGDADICPARTPENLDRLGAALRELGARIRTTAEPGGLAFACDRTFFEGMSMVNMVTPVGVLDVSFLPAGTAGYDDLARRQVVYEFGDVRVPVASLRDVIHSKETANRPKDHAVLPILYALEDEIAALEAEGGGDGAGARG